MGSSWVALWLSYTDFELIASSPQICIILTFNSPQFSLKLSWVIFKSSNLNFPTFKVLHLIQPSNQNLISEIITPKSFTLKNGSIQLMNPIPKLRFEYKNIYLKCYPMHWELIGENYIQKNELKSVNNHHLTFKLKFLKNLPFFN